MSKNMQLEAIFGNLPEYERCKSEFFEHFQLFLRLGVVNYAALANRTGVASGPTYEIVGIFLVGMALGKAEFISEQEGPDLKVDVWNCLGAWSLVEDELTAIQPVKQGGAA